MFIMQAAPFATKSPEEAKPKEKSKETEKEKQAQKQKLSLRERSEQSSTLGLLLGKQATSKAAGASKAVTGAFGKILGALKRK